MIRVVTLATLVACSQGVAPPRPNSVETCERTWEPYACLDAGHYFESQHDLQGAVVMYDHGCRRRLLDACVAGSKHSLELAAYACNMGYQPACMDAARYYDADLPRAKALLADVCKRDPARCGEAANILVEHEDEASALELVRFACSLPEQRDACRASASVRFRREDSRLEAGRLGCAVDVAESCLLAGRTSRSPEERRELYSRACTLKLPEGCTALGKLISEP